MQLCPPTGVLTTPAPNAVGSATVTAVVRDNSGTANGGFDTSPSRTFTITVINELTVASTSHDYGSVRDQPVQRPVGQDRDIQ